MKDSLATADIHSIIKTNIGDKRSFVPTQLAIETIRACNARCIMCPSSTMKREKGVMSDETHQIILKKLSDWAAPISVITHAGVGEPLLDKDLEEKIKNEKKVFSNAQIIVYTNGGLLSKERSITLIESGVDVVSFSINAFRKETYESIMNIPRDITYKNVEQFLEIKQKSSAKVNIHVSLVKTDICSLDEVDEFKRYWSAKQIQVVTPPWISWGNHLKHSIVKEQLPCFYIWKVMMIDYDGAVKMCCEDFDSRYPMGNLMKQTPDEIFNAPRMLQQRENQLNGNFLWPEICKNCIETYESAKDFWQSNPELVWINDEGGTSHNISSHKLMSSKTPTNQSSQKIVHQEQTSPQMKQLLDNFMTALDSLTQEQYKLVLGCLLAKGLEINDFTYPAGVWPPPTPARVYIKEFLNQYKSMVKGRCVEFAPAVYKDMFLSHDIISYDVWSISADTGVTIIADIQNASNIPNNYFDTIILTHVLPSVCNVWKAVDEIHRTLNPGGLVLCTVPYVLQNYAPHPKDYWRFTKDSLSDLFNNFSRCDIHSYGNAATVAGSPFYLMSYHYPKGFMAKHNENCPSVIAIAAWK